MQRYFCWIIFNTRFVFIYLCCLIWWYGGNLVDPKDLQHKMFKHKYVYHKFATKRWLHFAQSRAHPKLLLAVVDDCMWYPNQITLVFHIVFIKYMICPANIETCDTSTANLIYNLSLSLSHVSLKISLFLSKVNAFVLSINPYLVLIKHFLRLWRDILCGPESSCV